MRIIVTRYGGPDALQVVEDERPEPKCGEVRVRVLAAGVARMSGESRCYGSHNRDYDRHKEPSSQSSRSAKCCAEIVAT